MLHQQIVCINIELLYLIVVVRNKRPDSCVIVGGTDRAVWCKIADGAAHRGPGVCLVLPVLQVGCVAFLQSH